MTITHHGLEFGPPPTIQKPPTQIELAVQFLSQLLQDGPIPYPQIIEAAQAANLPEPTLRRAKKRLNIHSHRLPNQNLWAWSLPPS